MKSDHLQNKILEEFKQFFGTMTLKTMSKMTGIQNTRLFRIQNGSKMKLEEYQIFKELIYKNETENTDLSKLILSFEKLAKQSSIEKISKVIQRQIRILELTNNEVAR